MINLSISDLYSEKIDEAIFSHAAAAVLEHQAVTGNVDLSIALESDETLHNLNRQFRHIDRPTDVLSFPSDEVDPDTNSRYMGDVIISYPTAEVQAQEAGHPIIRELQLLTVHGVLHLLGHDHDTEENKAIMWQAQDSILNQLAAE